MYSVLQIALCCMRLFSGVHVLNQSVKEKEIKLGKFNTNYRQNSRVTTVHFKKWLSTKIKDS